MAIQHSYDQAVPDSGLRRGISSAACGLGLGTAALARCCPRIRNAGANRRPPTGGLPGLPHFAPRRSGPSTCSCPEVRRRWICSTTSRKMADWFDKDLPESIRKGQRLTTMTSGQTRFPDRAVEVQVPAVRPERHMGQRAAALHREDGRRHCASIKSVHTEAINHDPAITYICTGHQLPGRPSLGSWLSYGLGR